MNNEIKFKWEKVKCNLCGEDKLEIFLNNVRYFENNLEFNLTKCSNCSLIFVNPRPVKKDIGLFYKTTSYWGTNLKSKSENNNKKRDEIYGPIYNLIDSNKKKSILDIGAGIGLFLTKYKEKKWDVKGVEYSQDAVFFAKKEYGMVLKTGDFLESNFGKDKFDYIVLNNVLEHLFKPLETLKKINKTIKDDGLLIIAVPNINSLGFSIFKKNWYPLQPPIHLYQFSPDTLGKMLNKSGFKIEKIIHNYPIHSKFSFFESYRSQLTGRNNKPGVQTFHIGKSKKVSKEKINFIKELGVISGRIFANLFSIIGPLIGKGENIIIYAKKS